MIAKEDLQNGRFYIGIGYYTKIGLWDGDKFICGTRDGSRYSLISEHHYDDGLPSGTFKPKQVIDEKQVQKPWDGQTFCQLSYLMNLLYQSTL